MEKDIKPKYRGWDVWCCEAMCYLFASIPLTIVIATRSTPAVVGLIAFCILTISWFGKLKFQNTFSFHYFSTPLGLTGCLFLIWCLISIFWSSEPYVSFRKWIELFASVLLSAILICYLPEYLKKKHFRWFLAMIALSCFIILLELQTGLFFRKSIKGEVFTYIFNRPALTLVFLSIPILTNWKRAIAVLTGKSKEKWLWFLATTAGLICVVLGIADSGAAVLGGLTAFCAYCFIRFFPKTALGASVGLLIFLFTLAPFTGFLFDTLLPEKAFSILENAHARERVDIWKSFGKVTLEQPILGAGLDMSKFAEKDSGSYNLSLNASEKEALNMGHPHNAVLQIWYELGMVGAFLFLTICLIIVKHIWKTQTQFRAGEYAYFCAAIFVSASAHGFWQSWWIVTVASGIVWFIALARTHPLHTGKE